MAETNDTKFRLLERLKRSVSASASELAAEFGVTETAVRQHLDALERAGQVERFSSPPHGRGRPPINWRVTEKSGASFPDRHAELTADLLESIRTRLGDDALTAVLDDRAARQHRAYAAAIPIGALGERVRALAALRTAEGYLAEAHDQPDGTTLLVEHHCPIAQAAGQCQGLCAAELSVFQSVLGPSATVERRQHLLAGHGRCDYVIRPTARSM